MIRTRIASLQERKTTIVLHQHGAHGVNRTRTSSLPRKWSATNLRGLVDPGRIELPLLPCHGSGLPLTYGSENCILIVMGEKKSAQWILKSSGLSWLRIDLQGRFDLMLDEAKRLRSKFFDRTAPQKDVSYQYPTPANGWSALTLRGLSENRMGHFTQYGYLSDDEAPYQWTEVSKQCPETVKFSQLLPHRKLYRVRFLMLDPGGSISKHRDTNKNVLDRISIALQYPEGCSFEMNGGSVPFADGRAFLLNRSHEHEVKNPTDQDRIHLVIEGDFQETPGWDDLVVRSYKKYVG